MALEAHPRAEITSADWDGIVTGSPDGWVFSLFSWQELILAVEQWGLEEFSFGLRENGKLVAVVPLQFNPHNGKMSSSGWGGSGPVLDGVLKGKARERVMQAALEQCLAHAHARGAKQFDLSISPVTRTAIGCAWGSNPFVFYGLEDHSGLSQVIDLEQSQDELWAALSADARRQIRIARDQGFIVERADWGKCVKHYYELHEETYTRTGVQPHPMAYFSGIARHTAVTNNSVLWVVRSPMGEAVAYHNAAWFAFGAYYHTGCSTKEGSESGVSYLLFWEALCGAKAAGLKWYDCGAIFPNAADEKQRGLTTFKTKFGGAPHRAFVGVKYLEKLQSPSDPPKKRLFRQRAFNLLRQLVQQLKGSVAMVFQWGRPKIRFIRPFWSWQEIATALLWIGDKGARMEKLDSAFRKAIACNEKASVHFISSGRSALEAVFAGLKIVSPERNKVLLPSYGCLGILQPLLNTGLQPVFVDIEEDLLPSDEDILACLDQNTLAVLLVHLSGRGKGYEEVRARAKQLGVFVVDDFCHNLGGVPSVSEVDIAVFSFSLGKNASATAGGAIVDNVGVSAIKAIVDDLAPEPSFKARARFRHFLSLYGPAWWRILGARLPAANPDALVSRYKMFKMSELDATLLYLQLQKLGVIIKNRQCNAAHLHALIGEFSQIYGLQDSEGHIYTKMSVVLGTRRMFEAFMSFMNRQGIEIEGMYSPLHLRDEVAYIPHRSLKKTLSIFPRVVNVPVRPNLAKSQVRRIAKAMEKFAQRATSGQY